MCTTAARVLSRASTVSPCSGVSTPSTIVTVASSLASRSIMGAASYTRTHTQTDKQTIKSHSQSKIETVSIHGRGWYLESGALIFRDDVFEELQARRVTEGFLHDGRKQMRAQPPAATTKTYKTKRTVSLLTLTANEREN